MTSSPEVLPQEWKALYPALRTPGEAISFHRESFLKHSFWFRETLWLSYFSEEKKKSYIVSLKSGAPPAFNLKWKDPGLASLCRWLPDSALRPPTQDPNHKLCESFGESPNGKEMLSMWLSRWFLIQLQGIVMHLRLTDFKRLYGIASWQAGKQQARLPWKQERRACLTFINSPLLSFQNGGPGVLPPPQKPH